MKAFYEIVQDKSPKIHYFFGDNTCLMHFHRKIELLYNIKGEKTVFINGKKYVLEKNQLAISNSFEFHQYDYNEKSEQIVIIIPTKYLENYSEIMEGKTFMTNIILDKKFCLRILTYLTSVHDYLTTNPLIVKGAVNLLIGEIIEKIGLKEKPMSVNLDLIENIFIYIVNNLTENITLDSLSSHFGYSKFYFSRLFNSVFATNLNDYLAILRLEKVINLVNKDNMTITCAALSSGFNSMQTFYRSYKKIYGDKPIKEKKHSI